MTVMLAAPENVDVLAPLFDAYRSFYDQPSDLEGARTFLMERLGRGQSVVFMAVGADGESPVGFVQLYPLFSSVRMAPVWVLNDLFVLPEHRRTGAGRDLLEAAMAMGRSTGAVALQLETERENHAAQALYEVSGWKRDEEFEHYELTL
jgi:ribosomal protein S18 acetylase RimI-like enzyme